MKRTYSVVKTQRGTQGKWFRHSPAAKFATQEEADRYAADFADRQAGVGGTRILVLCRGRVVASYPVSA